MTDIMREFREDDLPVSTVDVARAVRAGRRRRRLAMGLTAGAVVVAVVAGVVTGAALLRSPTDPVLPAGPTCGGPTPARTATPTWERFDPLIHEIDAGGVQGYRVTLTGTATYWQTISLMNPANDRTVEVTFYACGGEPQSVVDETPVDPVAGEPAEAVHGAPAYWLPSSDRVALAWQWTPGAWAIVAPDGVGDSPPPPAELRDIATQVARQLRFGAGTPVTSPFTLPAPDGLHPAVTLTTGDRSAFFLGFDTLDSAGSTRIGGYVPYLWVNANASATTDQLPDGATEYPEDLGYPAYRTDQRGEGRDSDILLVYDFFGFGMEIEPLKMTGPRDARLGFAADIFRTITVYPGAATDPSAWGDPLTS